MKNILILIIAIITINGCAFKNAESNKKENIEIVNSKINNGYSNLEHYYIKEGQKVVILKIFAYTDKNQNIYLENRTTIANAGEKCIFNSNGDLTSYKNEFDSELLIDEDIEFNCYNILEKYAIAQKAE